MVAWVRLAAAGVVLGMTGAASAQQSADDPYIWLEDVHGARATEWVKAENQKALTTLQSDPRYEPFYKRALDALEAKDRIPYVAFRHGELHNFWQDPDHLKGILRRTSLASYRTADPKWETVLDIDALSKAEGKSWVYGGMQCLAPDERRCIVTLSEGGKDATVEREFDLVTKTFVEGGFSLPEGKQFAAWVDADTIARRARLGPGHHVRVRLPVHRQALEARPVARRGAGSVSRRREGHRRFPVGPQGFLRPRPWPARNSRTSPYLSSRLFVLGGAKPVLLDLPKKSQIGGIVDGRVLVSLQEAWQTRGQNFPVDALISYDLAAWKRDPNGAMPELVWSPADRQTLIGSGISKDELLVTLLDNVRGKASALNFANGRWTSKPIALPANATISMSGTDDRSNLAMFSVTDFLNPTSLYLYDGSSGRLEKIKSIPPQFDASKSEVVQHEAVSKDGARIPYFVIQPKGMKADGSTPTLLNGYGGFQNPQLPYYSATLGRLWLEHGNAYVVANIRGGGEFGPAWHQAAIRETKQKTWDDFIAVAEDVIKRGISSPRRLGVVGGSQGGLLVGTAITQRPELFNAAIVQVPLFDMLRYHLIGAGQSWAGEYGDPRVPEERAWLDAYSPYQKLKAGVKFPDPFFITSTADDRVTPVHGRKAAARMKEIGAPYLYFENMEGGHAGAANNPELARNITLEYIYATRRLVD